VRKRMTLSAQKLFKMCCVALSHVAAACAKLKVMSKLIAIDLYASGYSLSRCTGSHMQLMSILGWLMISSVVLMHTKFLSFLMFNISDIKMFLVL
jgi:hypothetical protein